MAAERVVGAAVLDEGGLGQCVEGFAVGGGGEAFETLVVGAAGFRVLGVEFPIGVVDWWTVCAEGDGVIAGREEGGRGLDGGEEFAGAGEVVDIGAIFVADPVAPITGEY